MKREIGRRAEELAVEHLIGQRYVIIERNFRCRWGEIDIICRKDGVLVFVEVRSKRSERFGSPEESINYNKMSKIRKTAFEYLNERNLRIKEIRFDFIGIDFQSRQPIIKHIEGAF
ncbi:MAG: YraN family protein [Syntrophomonadaceae bacterium]|nr:YraN family protein [Syntrophomonadaceae bacterium]